MAVGHWAQRWNGLLVPKGSCTSFKIPTIVRKICLLGDPGVGKTSLVYRLAAHRFDEFYVTTVGARVLRKSIIVRPQDFMTDVRVKLMIWEVRGHCGLTPINPYLNGTDAAVVIGDAQRLDTQIDLWKWIERTRAASGDIPVMMLINKTDIMDSEFDPELVEELSAEYGCPIRMTSARTGANVDRTFKELALQLVRFPRQEKFCGG
jgi:small GTP-binding protein